MMEGNGKLLDPHDVLVVEDDPEINCLVGAYVELAGYNYVSALNGNQALEHARGHAPSAVVLDLMLPDLSGWEVCRWLKAHRETRHIPVIILTALDSDDSRREGVRCGVAEYLTKPFDPDRLLDVLRQYAGAGSPWDLQVVQGTPPKDDENGENLPGGPL